MNPFNSARRDLLRVGSLGMAGAALPSLASAAASKIRSPAIPTAIFNVRQYGATGDGKTLDTDAVNRAIEAAAAAGGGTVLFPAGVYLCFSIHLQEQRPSPSRAGRHHPRRRIAQARRNHRLQRRHLRRGRAQHRHGTPIRTTATTTGTTPSSGAKTCTTSPSPALASSTERA